MVWLATASKLAGEGGQSIILLDVDVNVQQKTLTVADIPINDARALHIHGVGITYTANASPAGPRSFLLKLSVGGTDVFQFPLDAAVDAAQGTTSHREVIADLSHADASTPTDTWGVAPESGLFHWWPPDVWLPKGATFHVESYNNEFGGDDMSVFVRGRLY